ncbi:MAG: class I SAM-dependent methyltransferase [Syntrophales bacterium]|jgi:SAM-dependent methyltransferase|nr:class I SAM-dependent methyltransferase [Syntrophales bacterium]
MNKRAVRACPVCENVEAELLHTQKFVLPEGHPLSQGYDVVCCHECGFVYADTSVTQDEYDLFYAKYSKYEDNKTATGGGKTSWEQKRFDETASFIYSFLPDRKAGILDIGCANGGLLKAFRGLGYTKLFGVDPSSACVENVRRLGIDAQVGSLSDPLNFGLYDCILLSHVLEHVINLKGALSAIYLSATDKHKTYVYIEVPNASQYNDYVFAPFQDFNTEHINHFSQRCLENLMNLCGFTVIIKGEKEIESSPGMPYPSIYSVSAINDQRPNQFSLAKDVELVSNIRDYIAKSKTILAKIDNKIQQVLAKSNRLIVWGTGQLVMKLLAETSLAKADIVAFVDNNPINQGKMLKDIPIISPEKIGNLPHPILVTTLLHQKEIAKQINILGLSNSIIFLDK